MTLKHFAILLVAAGSLTGCIAGKFMSNVALKPANHGVEDIERTRAKADSLAPGVIAWSWHFVIHGVAESDMTEQLN